MPLFQAQVIHQRDIASDYLEIEFEWPKDVPAPEPGQFITVRAGGGPTPLLRRPFGISGWRPGRAQMIYWRRGPATRMLAASVGGDSIDVLGPLGFGFPLPAGSAATAEATVDGSQGPSRQILVAGGVGIGPILFLAHRLDQSETGGVHVVVGARTADGLPDVEFGSRTNVTLCTDDGSAGRSGSSIDALADLLEASAEQTVVHLCGPHGMLAAGHHVCAKRGVQAFVSMEQTMGCAVGACMGCAVQVNDESSGDEPVYKRVCTEGPVFDSSEIRW